MRRHPPLARFASLVAVVVTAGCALVTDEREAERLDPDGDGVLWPVDCDDDDSQVGGPRAWYADLDLDGFGTGEPTAACDAPGAEWAPAAGDCDDDDASVNPDAEEVCDDADNDCDGSVDEGVDPTTWYADADADGYGDPLAATLACTAPDGTVDNDQDCDDGDASISPDAPEVCNGVDDDCDGLVDDDDEVADGGTWWPDDDGDGYGDHLDPQVACEQPAGTVDNDQDCDDTDPAVVSYTWYEDADGDGYGVEGSTTEACSQPSGYADNTRDCDDGDPTIYPGATTWAVPGDAATIQDAVDLACDEDTITVDAGTYRENVVVSAKALTITSLWGATLTVIDGGGAGSTFAFDGVDGGALVGFTLTGGAAADGGGLAVTESTGLDLRELVVTGNTATNDGGGVRIAESSDVSLADSEISANTAGSAGGGVSVEATSGSTGDLVTLAACTIAFNSADDGGGLAVDTVQSVEITEVSVTDNTAASAGGGRISVGGIGWIDETTFARNTADSGASALLTEAGPGAYLEISEIGFHHNVDGGAAAAWAASLDGAALEVAGLVATENRGSGSLGAVTFSLSGGASASLVNVASAGNAGAGISADLADAADTFALAFATLAGNEGDGLDLSCVVAGQAAVAAVIAAGNGGYGVEAVGEEPTVATSDVWDNAAGEYAGLSDPTGSDGNLSEDPLFSAFAAGGDPGLWDLHLASGSLAIDTGSSSTADPDGSAADMGVYGGPDADFAWYDDTDSDGLYDGWELWWGLDTSADDRTGDLDGDGLDNAAEQAAGTCPSRADTDRDGLTDDLDTSPLQRDDPSPDARVAGDAVGQQAGTVLCSPGDLDADGQADLVIGSTGRLWYLLGPLGGDISVGSASVALEGVTALTEQGVTGGGDLDLDGQADLLVGDARRDASQGAVYLVSGLPDSSGPLNVEATATLRGEWPGDAAGTAVSGAGDLDGDGAADLVVGAPGQDGGATDGGAVYVVLGPLTSDLSLSSATASLTAGTASAAAGTAVDGRGDTDGDGLADLVVGAPGGDGTVFVIFGPATAAGTLDAADAVVAGAVSSGLGRDVTWPGDVDGDGYDDLAVAANGQLGGSGAVWVLFGPLTGALDGTSAAGTWLGEAAGDAVNQVARAGDLDGDGRADLLVSTSEHDASKGAAYLLLGPATGTGDLGSADRIITGIDSGDRAGASLAGAQDLDGDGSLDIAVGVPYDDEGATDAGAAWLFSGGGL